MKRRLKSARQYLKTDYKIHLERGRVLVLTTADNLPRVVPNQNSTEAVRISTRSTAAIDARILRM